MLYTFGDSMTYGWDLARTGMTDEERQAITWPLLLSKKIGQPVKDFSYPGVSSWRIARQIQNLSLSSDDTVVIQWTNPYRFEFGVSEEYNYNQTLKDTDPHHNPDYDQFDVIEKVNGIRTKMMCSTLLYRTSDGPHKDFMSYAYNEMRNDEWYEEMFRIMMASCLYHFEKSECKFIMFDGWKRQCHPSFFSDIPQYLLRGSTTAANYGRGHNGTELVDKKYPTPSEHKRIADFVALNLQKIYG